jgi:hypothetical protein
MAPVVVIPGLGLRVVWRHLAIARQAARVGLGLRVAPSGYRAPESSYWSVLKATPIYQFLSHDLPVTLYKVAGLQ